MACVNDGNDRVQASLKSDRSSLEDGRRIRLHRSNKCRGSPASVLRWPRVPHRIPERFGLDRPLSAAAFSSLPERNFARRFLVPPAERRTRAAKQELNGEMRIAVLPPRFIHLDDASSSATCDDFPAQDFSATRQ
jgi:hypothetical protein